MMARDNIAGAKKGGIIKNIFLFPGKVWQWIMYMTVGNAKGYGKVRQRTRLARSPFMTFVYSMVFWLVVAWLGLEFYFLEIYGNGYLIDFS
tara:strand:+ start:73 stop:345 length:273 start_codon:yes stop_codon:yes gene_type:complete